MTGPACKAPRSGLVRLVSKRGQRYLWGVRASCRGLNKMNTPTSKLINLHNSFKHGITSMTLQNKYTTKVNTTKQPHPYKKIHPWKSKTEFSKHLLDSVFYNEDGLVALNKPYGISGKSQTISNKDPALTRINSMVGVKEYNLSEAIEYIQESLNYPALKLIKTPERYTSGVTLLAANEKIEKAVQKSMLRGEGFNVIPRVYWIVTTNTPEEKKGKMHLAMRLQDSSCKTYRKVLSSTPKKLSSLIEIKSSTVRWHAIRLFAATILRSPVLGDRMYGSLVKKAMGAWLHISPFSEASEQMPRLSDQLLKLLELSPAMQEIIPTHIHLRRIHLPWYLGREKDLILEAPLNTEFAWTCDRLKLNTVAKTAVCTKVPRDSIIVSETNETKESVVVA